MNGYEMSSRQENINIFIRASLVGGCFLIIYFLTQVFNEVIYMIVRNYPQFWYYDNGNIADSFVYIFYAVICFALPALVFSKIMGVSIYKSVSFAKAKKGTGIPVFLAAVGIIPVANYINNLVVNLFKSYNFNPTDGIEIYSPESLAGIVLYAIHLAVIPAFCEELLCRGFAFGSMRKFGEHTAAIFSAVVFALFHKNFQQIPFAFILGLVFAYAISITGSIWIPMLVHFVNNLGSFSFELLSQYVSEDAYRIISGMYMMLLAVLGCVGIVWISMKIGKGKISIPSYDGAITIQKRNVMIYSSPTVIAFMGLMIYLAIENMR